MKNYIVVAFLIVSSLIYCTQPEIRPYSLEKGPIIAQWSSDSTIFCYNAKENSWVRYQLPNNKKPFMRDERIYVRKGKENSNNPALAKFKVYLENMKWGSLTCRKDYFGNFLNAQEVKVEKIKIGPNDNFIISDALFEAALKFMKEERIKSVSANITSSNKTLQEIFIRAGFTIEKIEKDQSTNQIKYYTFVKNLEQK